MLSTLSASLSKKGVLTVSRDDASLVIQIDFLNLVSKKASKPPTKGTIVVVGVAKFDLKKVKSIRIDPGPSTSNVRVNEPRNIRIPVKILPARPSTITPPPSNGGGNGGVVVPGVTGNQSVLEQLIFDLVNAERIKSGVAPLSSNSKLITAAQIHARDMASLNLMEHDLPGVAQPTLISRAEFVGYRYGFLGENLGGFFEEATSLVAGWMASPGHRSNMLNANLTEAGIGVGRDSQGNLYFCQVFASPLA